MGWSSGTYVMDHIIRDIEKLNLDFEQKVSVYTYVIDALEGADWDCQDECRGQSTAYDKALEIKASW